MGRFIIIFFCSILSIGKIETASNEQYAWQRNNDDRGPILKEQMFLVQGYQNIQGVKSEPRNGPTESCLKHNKSPESSVLPLPSRRAFFSQSQRNPWMKIEASNVPPQVLGYEDNKLRSSNNEETYSPQLLNNEDRVAESQNALQESSPASNEDVVEDGVIENTSPLDETILLINEIPPNQEIGQVLEIKESRNLNSDVTGEQISPTLTVEPSTYQSDAGCSKKHDTDSLALPPRRNLLPSPQRTIMTHNNDQPSAKRINTYSQLTPNLLTNDNINQLGETSDVNGKTVIKTQNLHDDKNINNLSQKTDEDLDRTGNANYVYTGNSHNNLQDPAKGDGISYVNKNTVKLIDYDRVCYACSSAYNPTCISPDRKTTVKYCRKGVNSCVTKSFGTGSTLTLIRDCGKTCNDAKIPGLIPNYKTCSICHTDLCNGSYSVNVYSSILALPTVVLIALTKPFGFG